VTELNTSLQKYKSLLIKKTSTPTLMSEEENITFEQYEYMIDTTLKRMATIKGKLEWSVNKTYLMTFQRFKKWFAHYLCPSCKRDYLKPKNFKTCPYCDAKAKLCPCSEPGGFYCD